MSDNFLINPNWTSQDVIKGALRFLPEISHSCVITTNFDKVLEKVFEFSKKPFEGFMLGAQQNNKFVTDLIKGDRCILKLHGSVGEEKTYVFTKSQYDKVYGAKLSFKKELPKTLRQIFISHSLLFVGCSLEQDRTLELFQEVKKEGQFEIPQHYAILPQPLSHSDKRKKENYLREINIKTIWYPTNKHDFVEKILKLANDAANDRIKI